MQTRSLTFSKKELRPWLHALFADLGEDPSPQTEAHFAKATELLEAYYAEPRSSVDLPVFDALPAETTDANRGARPAKFPRRTACPVPGSHWTMLSRDDGLSAVEPALLDWLGGL